MLIVTGWNSAIVQALLPMLPIEERVERADCHAVGTYGDRYVFAAGLLRPKPFIEQTEEEIGETFMVNAGSVIIACERILAHSPRARICVIGSESGFAWSYDGAYAAAKSALHRYVETKKLRTPSQQLVAIAPSIIGDAGMTTRRTDVENLAEREAQHPKRRFLKAAEVAQLVHFCLYQDEGYLSGTVIRMNGGPQ